MVKKIRTYSNGFRTKVIKKITYIWDNQGLLYLVWVKVIHTKKLVGYTINKRMTADLVGKALNMAVKNRGPSQRLIVHSDNRRMN